MKFCMDIELFFAHSLTPISWKKTLTLLISNYPKLKKKLLPQPNNNTPLPTKKSRTQKTTSTKLEKKNPSTTKTPFQIQKKITSPTHRAHIPGGLKNNVTRWNHEFLRQFVSGLEPLEAQFQFGTCRWSQFQGVGRLKKKTRTRKTLESDVISIVWANYSGLSRGHPKWWFSEGIPPNCP